MRQKRITFIFLAVGLLLVAFSAFLMATPAKAQCGSQASSCKSCHETQAQKPVNSDGTAWHTQHAFGDFCYLCHAGNNTATDKTAAHTGMVDPLQDVKTNCSTCHPANKSPKDYLTLAQVYATTLGVTIGNVGGSTAPTAASGSPTTAVVTQSAPAAALPVAVVPASDMVDYSERYNEVALGQKPANTGNIILIVVLAILVLGGGFFILKREGFINIHFDDPKRVAVQDKYPADVVELLPGIGKLNSDSRRTLKNILQKPDAAGDLFASIEKLTRVEPPADKPAGEPGEDNES